MPQESTSGSDVASTPSHVSTFTTFRDVGESECLRPRSSRPTSTTRSVSVDNRLLCHGSLVRSDRDSPSVKVSPRMEQPEDSVPLQAVCRQLASTHNKSNGSAHCTLRNPRSRTARSDQEEREYSSTSREAIPPLAHDSYKRVEDSSCFSHRDDDKLYAESGEALSNISSAGLRRCIDTTEVSAEYESDNTAAYFDALSGPTHSVRRCPSWNQYNEFSATGRGTFHQFESLCEPPAIECRDDNVSIGADDPMSLCDPTDNSRPTGRAFRSESRSIASAARNIFSCNVSSCAIASCGSPDPPQLPFDSEASGEIITNRAPLRINSVTGSSCITAAMAHDFKNRIVRELTCPICLELFRLPVTVECGHTFCRYCICHNKLSRKTCPLCRQPLSSAISINTVLSNLLNALYIRRRLPSPRCSIIRTEDLIGERWWSETCIKHRLAMPLALRLLLKDIATDCVTFFDDLVACVMDHFDRKALWTDRRWCFTLSDLRIFCRFVCFNKNDKEETLEHLHRWVEQYVSSFPSVCGRRPLTSSEGDPYSSCGKLAVRILGDHIHRIEGQVFDSQTLQHSLPWDVGRHSHSLLPIPHSSVSLSHLLLTRDKRDGKVCIVDMGSTIGTMVKVEDVHTLQSGDLIHIGDRVEVTAHILKSPFSSRHSDGLKVTSQDATIADESSPSTKFGRRAFPTEAEASYAALDSRVLECPYISSRWQTVKRKVVGPYSTCDTGFHSGNVLRSAVRCQTGSNGNAPDAFIRPTWRSATVSESQCDSAVDSRLQCNGEGSDVLQDTIRTQSTTGAESTFCCNHPSATDLQLTSLERPRIGSAAQHRMQSEQLSEFNAVARAPVLPAHGSCEDDTGSSEVDQSALVGHPNNRTSSQGDFTNQLDGNFQNEIQSSNVYHSGINGNESEILQRRGRFDEPLEQYAVSTATLSIGGSTGAHDGGFVQTDDAASATEGRSTLNSIEERTSQDGRRRLSAEVAFCDDVDEATEPIDSFVLITIHGNSKQETRDEWIDPRGTLLGRGPQNPSCPLKKLSVTGSNGYVSRQHCIIYYDGRQPPGHRWMLKDVSTLGTFIRLKPLEPHPCPLSPHSVFKVGQCKMEVSHWGARSRSNPLTSPSMALPQRHLQQAFTAVTGQFDLNRLQVGDAGYAGSSGSHRGSRPHSGAPVFVPWVSTENSTDVRNVSLGEYAISRGQQTLASLRREMQQPLQQNQSAIEATSSHPFFESFAQDRRQMTGHQDAYRFQDGSQRPSLTHVLGVASPVPSLENASENYADYSSVTQLVHPPAVMSASGLGEILGFAGNGVNHMGDEVVSHNVAFHGTVDDHEGAQGTQSEIVRRYSELQRRARCAFSSREMNNASGASTAVDPVRGAHESQFQTFQYAQEGSQIGRSRIVDSHTSIHAVHLGESSHLATTASHVRFTMLASDGGGRNSSGSALNSEHYSERTSEAEVREDSAANQQSGHRGYESTHGNGCADDLALCVSSLRSAVLLDDSRQCMNSLHGVDHADSTFEAGAEAGEDRSIATTELYQ